MLFRLSSFKPADWSFADFRFTTDACLTGGGTTCLDKCLTFPFPDFVLHAASHISALELFTVIVAVKLWATALQHHALRVWHIPGEHNTLAGALSRWDNTSSHTQFAQATTALGISYVFEEIPRDFCYFDVV